MPPPRPVDAPGSGNVLQNPVITGLAEKYGKTPAQVILRWHLDEGRSALPKSVTPARIALGLDTGLRGGPDPELLNTRTFPRTVDNS